MTNLLHLKCVAIYFLIQFATSTFIEPMEIEILEGIDYSFSIEYCTLSISHHQTYQTNVSALCYCIYDPITKTSSHCSVPGPTFIVYSGTTISMTWYNNLITDDNYVWSEFANQPKDLDITNIHLHGMHISPNEDNVLLEILPGSSHQYIYNILPDHYPGTLWLHVHHHGSASFQIHAGLFSALLLKYKDKNDLIDNSLINMKENVLIFHFIYAITTDLCDCTNETLWKSLYYYPPNPQEENREQECLDGRSCFVAYSYCFEYCIMPTEQRSVSGFKYEITSNYTQSEFILFLVNGQFEPIIDDLTVNMFRRLRFINTYNQFYIQYLFPLVGCEWYLIAIDGIFLNDNDIRSLNEQPYFGQYILPPGGRIDVIVKCSEIGTYFIETTESNEYSQIELQTLTRAPGGNKLFGIKVNFDGLDIVTEKPISYPLKPNYLKDLRTETIDTMKQCSCNTYIPENNAKLLPWNNNECGLVFNMAKTHNINGYQFDINTPMTYLDLDSVYEFKLFVHMHPLHHHTNPFQIQYNVGTNGFIAKSGDWFDTFGVGKNVEVIMRMFTSNFYGHQVIHCHILPHEDKGQMTYYEILQSNQFCDDITGQIITNPTTSITNIPTIFFQPIIPTDQEIIPMDQEIIPIDQEMIPTLEPVISIPQSSVPTHFIEENIGVFNEDYGQVTIEMCLIKEAIPSPCSCGVDCNSIEYEYTAIVSEKCGDQILITGDYGAETCNPLNNAIYEVGKIYECKVLSCENGEFDVMDSANMIELFQFYILLVFYVIISCY